MKNALIVVDIQNDFVSGSLPVPDGAEIAESTAHLITFDWYDKVVATKDYHIDPGEHFAESEPDFVNTWPVHCKAGTEGKKEAPPKPTALVRLLPRASSIRGGAVAAHEPKIEQPRARLASGGPCIK